MVELARHASVPVINALSDAEHPCQALADLLTIYEKKGRLAGLKLAYVGDANNVANSLMLAAALTGMEFRLASPAGYGPGQEVQRLANEYTRRSGARVVVTDDPKQAVAAAGGQMALLGGISNVEALLQGTPDDVYQQARYNIEAGVDSIGPECAISLQTPLANLKAIVAAAEEGY